MIVNIQGYLKVKIQGYLPSSTSNVTFPSVDGNLPRGIALHRFVLSQICRGALHVTNFCSLAPVGLGVTSHLSSKDKPWMAKGL